MRHFLFTTLAFLISTISFSQLVVGQKITGDFNGNGKPDTAFLVVKSGQKTKAHVWMLSFNDKTIPAIELGCCDPILINEGDLNGDRSAEISVFQAPENGCVYMWTTYSLRNKQWTKLIEPFLIATDCEDFKEADLRNRVFKENGKVYYRDVDPNDEEAKPVKRQVSIH